jgi:predicted Fe-Mo cluster-binding NifX family protein
MIISIPIDEKSINSNISDNFGRAKFFSNI